MVISDQPSVTALPPLTIEAVILQAREFSIAESTHNEPSLFGKSDGKNVGTYLEQKFVNYLTRRYSFVRGNPASGIDLPEINVDIKVTSNKLPQSSSPFKSIAQRVFGLGYNLIIFSYEKSDDKDNSTSRLDIIKTVFVKKKLTSDYNTTKNLREIIDCGGNKDAIISFLQNGKSEIDNVLANELAERILTDKPEQGYLGMSNALQWRLRYAPVLRQAGLVEGIYDCSKPQESLS